MRQFARHYRSKHDGQHGCDVKSPLPGGRHLETPTCSAARGPLQRSRNKPDQQQSQQEKFAVLPRDISVGLVGAGSGWDHRGKRRRGASEGGGSPRLLLQAVRSRQNGAARRTSQSHNRGSLERTELPPAERIPKVRKESVFDKHISPVLPAVLTGAKGEGEEKRRKGDDPKASRPQNPMKTLTSAYFDSESGIRFNLNSTVKE